MDLIKILILFIKKIQICLLFKIKNSGKQIYSHFKVILQITIQ